MGSHRTPPDESRTNTNLMFKPTDILTASLPPEQAHVNRSALQEPEIADALAPYEPLSTTYS